MRLIALFPPEDQDVMRIRLSESLNAVVSQRLLPRKDAEGRIAVVEVMVMTPAIRAMILENRIGEIRDQIAAGRDEFGMQTFDQHLEELVAADAIDVSVAKAAAARPSEFQLKAKKSK
jgi:twitching motility protein PilT